MAENIISDLAGMSGDSRLLARYTSTNTGHGQIEERECTVACFGDTTGKMFRHKFAGLQSVVSMKCGRTVVSTGERTEESRYYITSMDAGNAEEIANAIRQHWSIENSLHWQLEHSGKTREGR